MRLRLAVAGLGVGLFMGVMAAAATSAGSVTVQIGFSGYESGLSLHEPDSVSSNGGMNVAGTLTRLVPVERPDQPPEGARSTPGTFEYHSGGYTYRVMIVYATFFPPQQVVNDNEFVAQLNARIQLVSSNDPDCKAPAVGTLLLRKYGRTSSSSEGLIELSFPSCPNRTNGRFAEHVDVYLQELEPASSNETPAASTTQTTTSTTPAASIAPTKVMLSVDGVVCTQLLIPKAPAQTCTGGSETDSNWNIKVPNAAVKVTASVNAPLPHGDSLQINGSPSPLCVAKSPQESCSVTFQPNPNAPTDVGVSFVTSYGGGGPSVALVWTP